MKNKSYTINGTLGLAVVGVSFGIARYGYGLFLPQAEKTFDINPVIQGSIASGSYAAYLIATMLAAYISNAYGPRIPVLTGLLFAFIGTFTVFAANSASLFALGIIIAGASPGFIFPALSDWSIYVGKNKSDRLFAIMNSGTGAGVILAAPLALFVIDNDWQLSWLLFAALALVLGVISTFVVPNTRNNTIEKSNGVKASYLLIKGALPLYICALIAGFTTAAYWTFSVSLVTTYTYQISNIRPEIIFWLVTGISGFLGAMAGDAVLKFGIIVSYKITMLAISLALFSITLSSGGVIIILASSLLFGASFIFVTGILSVWSMRIFSSAPAIGMGYTFFIFTLGAMLGPFAGGHLIESSGHKIMFIVFSILALLPVFIPTSILYYKESLSAQENNC